MSARVWAIATAVLGLGVLALFAAFALLPEARAAAECLPPNAVVQFELARNHADLLAIFGEAGGDCRPLSIAAMDAVNRLDTAAFIPIYTAFLIAGALFLSDGVVGRPLTVAAIAAAVLAAAGDYLETTSLLAITQILDAPGDLLVRAQFGAWSKFALLAAHAVFCAGLCFAGERRRLILGVLLMAPSFGVAAAAFDQHAFISVLNGGFAVAWFALLAMAFRAALLAQHAPA